MEGRRKSLPKLRLLKPNPDKPYLIISEYLLNNQVKGNLNNLFIFRLFRFELSRLVFMVNDWFIMLVMYLFFRLILIVCNFIILIEFTYSNLNSSFVGF